MWRQEGDDVRKAMGWEENIRDLKIIDKIYMAITVFQVLFEEFSRY